MNRIQATESAERSLVPGFLIKEGLSTIEKDRIHLEDFDRFWGLLVALNGDTVSASLIARAGIGAAEIQKSPVSRSVLEAMAAIRYFGV